MSEHTQRVIGWVFIVIGWCLAMGLSAAFVDGDALNALTAVSMLGGLVIGAYAVSTLI